MKRWVPALVCLVFGVGVGACQAKGSKPDDTVIVKTKYVDRPVDRKVVVDRVSIPSNCADALDLAAQIKKEASKLVGVSTSAQDILSAAHAALASKDGAELNKQRDELYKLEVRNDDASQDLSLTTMPRLDEALRKCKATKAYKEKK